MATPSRGGAVEDAGRDSEEQDGETHALLGAADAAAVVEVATEPEGTTSSMCRICHGFGGQLIRPCQCDGSLSQVHVECLERWIRTRNDDPRTARCELCLQPYQLQLQEALVLDAQHACSARACPVATDGICQVVISLFVAGVVAPLLPEMFSAATPLEATVLTLLLGGTLLLMGSVVWRRFQHWRRLASDVVIVGDQRTATAPAPTRATDAPDVDVETRSQRSAVDDVVHEAAALPRVHVE